MALRLKLLDQVLADKPGTPGYKDILLLYIISHILMYQFVIKRLYNSPNWLKKTTLLYTGFLSNSFTTERQAENTTA